MSFFKYTKLLLLLLAALACRKLPEKNEVILYNQDGTLISKPFLFKLPINVNSEYENGGAIYGNIHYQGAALLIKRIKDRFYLCIVDSTEGKSRWEKLLNIDLKKNIFFLDWYYFKSPYYYTILRDIVRINLDNGEIDTLAYDSDPHNSKHFNITGIGDYIFYSVSDSFPNITYNHTAAGYYYNIEEDKAYKFLEPRYHIPASVEYKKYSKKIEGIYPIQQSGEVLLLIRYSIDYINLDYWDYEKNHFQQYLGIFSFIQQKWIYDSIKIRPSLGQPHIENNRIYSYSITSANCHDLMSGNLIWEKEYPFSFDGVMNNGVYGNTFVLLHKSGFIMGLDKDTGQEQWRTPSSNTVSYFQEYNGVLYYVNAGRGKIHAVDIETGKMLWRLNYPDPSGFVYCTVIPGKDGEKGRIIACTYDYAYCYETER